VLRPWGLIPYRNPQDHGHQTEQRQNENEYCKCSPAPPRDRRWQLGGKAFRVWGQFANCRHIRAANDHLFHTCPAAPAANENQIGMAYISFYYLKSNKSLNAFPNKVINQFACAPPKSKFEISMGTAPNVQVQTPCSNLEFGRFPILLPVASERLPGQVQIRRLLCFPIQQ
jgi:hypothetical protein